MGFILYDQPGGSDRRSVDAFGPYFIEQYILMEVLSKQEVAQNVLDYYCRSKDKLERGLATYDEAQGKGFVCWRFLLRESQAAAGAGAAAGTATGEGKAGAEGGVAVAPGAEAMATDEAPPPAPSSGPSPHHQAEAEAEIDEIFSGAGI